MSTSSATHKQTERTQSRPTLSRAASSHPNGCETLDVIQQRSCHTTQEGQDQLKSHDRTPQLSSLQTSEQSQSHSGQRRGIYRALGSPKSPSASPTSLIPTSSYLRETFQRFRSGKPSPNGEVRQAAVAFPQTSTPSKQNPLAEPNSLRIESRQRQPLELKENKLNRAAQLASFRRNHPESASKIPRIRQASTGAQEGVGRPHRAALDLSEPNTPRESQIPVPNGNRGNWQHSQPTRAAPVKSKAQLLLRVESKAQLLLRVGKNDDAAHQHHRTQVADRREEVADRGSSRKKNNERAYVHSISDAQLKARYEFVKEIGYGEWGSIWSARACREIDTLPPSAYTHTQRVKLNGHGIVSVDESSDIRPIAIKLCTRERTSASSARTERLWNEFKVVRSIMEQPDASNGGSRQGGDRSRRNGNGSKSQRPVRGEDFLGSDWHPNIVPFYEFLITPSFAMIVMPCYDEPMKVGLPDDRCRSYFQQLLSAVFWLHQKNVTHNDIKVGNILVNYDDSLISKGTPILVDFGFAKIHDPQDPDAFRTNVSWGTPEYLSPERARGDMHDERGSDLWSLGVTFFEIATTRTPFEEADEQFVTREQMQAYYHRTMSGVWIGTWDIPPELEDLVRRMLEPSPVARIEAAEALLHPYFDPHASSYDTSFEDILSLGSSDDSAGPALMPRSLVIPEPFPCNGPLSPIASNQYLREDVQTQASWHQGSPRRGEVGAGPLSPTSPTLSAIGMDSCYTTELMHNPPPWTADTMVDASMVAPAQDEDRRNPSDESATVHFAPHALDTDGRGMTDRAPEVPVLTVESASLIRTPTKALGVSRPQTSPSPLKLSPLNHGRGLATVSQRNSQLSNVPTLIGSNAGNKLDRSPIKIATSNVVAKSFARPLAPAKHGRLPAMLDPEKSQCDTPLTPNSRRVMEWNVANQEAVEGIPSPQTPSPHQEHRNDHTFGESALSRVDQATGTSPLPGNNHVTTPKQGTRVVASLARRFDSPISPLGTSNHGRSLSVKINNNANEHRLSLNLEHKKQADTSWCKGHRRSGSHSKAIQTVAEQKVVERRSVGVQVNIRSQRSAPSLMKRASRPRTAETVPRPISAAGRSNNEGDDAIEQLEDIVDACEERNVSGDVCDPLDSVSIDSCSTSRSESLPRRVKVAKVQHRPISASLGIPRIWGPGAGTRELRTQSQSGSSHRRTMTDSEGVDIVDRLKDLSDVADTLTRLIDDTRASILSPAPPSRERVEAIYASYLLRNDSVKKLGDGYEGSPPSNPPRPQKASLRKVQSLASISMLKPQGPHRSMSVSVKVKTEEKAKATTPGTEAKTLSNRRRLACSSLWKKLKGSSANHADSSAATPPPTPKTPKNMLGARRVIPATAT